MGKRKNFYKAMALALCIIVSCGCGTDHELDLNNHEAMKMRDAGVYEVRYHSSRIGYNSSETIGGVLDCISINVNEEMSEEDMLTILDYYELVHNGDISVVDGYKGERDEDYICYAVFYEGNTDNELQRIKYFNNKKVDITDEDEAYFPPPYFRDESED